MAKIIGTSRDDTIAGTNSHDKIFGLNGNDRIWAGGGNDFVSGGNGKDEIRGEDGCDVLLGGNGKDKLFGGAHSDLLFGGNGNDILDGGEGSDFVSGGRGNDTGIFRPDGSGHGYDIYDGGKGRDTLVLEVTREQANSAQFIAELKAYEEFIESNSGHHGFWEPFFVFNSIGLKARNWEKLEVVVIDDPAPLAQVSVSDAETTEGDDLVFTVSLDGPAAADVTVDYEIVLDGSASAADLAAGLVLTGTVTIAAGATSADIVAGTFDDALFEGTEDLRLELSNPSANAAIADGDGAGTILDNDPAPLAQVSVSDAETTEGDDLVFTVSLDGPAAADVTVDYEILLDGSASAADLAAGLVLTGTVTIAAGATSADIVAGTFDDALFEGTEDLRLELSNPSANAAIADGDGAGTILDNDPAPLAQVSVSDAETTEGDDLVFTVSLDGPAAADVTVDYEIVLDGSASAADLAAGLVLTGTVTITAGATSADIVAGTFDDALFEGTEDLRLELSNPSANAAIADGDGAGTILDNDPAPLAQVSVSDAETTEGDDLVFTVSLDGPAAADVTVDYEIVLDGSASAADLAAGLVLTGTVTIAAGATSADIVAGTFDDALFEGTEDLRLELSNPSANAAIADGDGAGTILDNDPAPLAQVSVSDAETTEGDDLVFTVSLDGPAAADVTVDYEIVLDGSASAADLAAGLVLTGTVTIAAGATSADIVAGTFDDALFEGTEDLRLELSNPSANAAIADGDGAGTILDNDPAPLAQVSVSDAETTEGDDLVFTVSLDGPAAADVTVDYEIVLDGSASAADLAAGLVLTGTVTIAAGATSADIVAGTFDDALFEGTEDLRLELSNPSANAAIADGDGAGTILDNDPAPLAQVSVSDAETTEGDDLVFTVSLDGPAAADVTVDYEIVLDGSASAADLAAGLVLTGTVTIAAGATSADIVAGTFDDALFEGTEDLRLELSNPSANAAIADGDGAGTILDNDPAPLAQVSVSDAETTEGDDLVFTVSLDGPAAADVTVDYEIVLDGSASAADLAAGLVLTGTVTIAAGATSADIVAGTFDDALFEGTEDLRLELSNPSANAAIADGDGAGTILDNDPAPLAQVSVSDAETTEGDDLVFTVSLDGPAAADVTVDYEIVLDGSASAADLAAGLVLTGTVTIAAGATSADIVAGTFDDALFEGTEDLRLELSNPSANAAIADGDGAGTILDNDPAPLAQVSVSDAETTEGDDLVFTVSLDGPAAADVTVDYEIVLDGSASAADLAAGLVLTGTVTIAAGATSADIVAGTFDDALFEGTEDLRLELSNPSANAAIADGDGAGTILDNDPAPLAQVSVSDAETTEGDDLVFTVSLDGPAAADVTVDYEIVLDGSASAADLAAGLVLTGTVTIAAGATSADIVAGTFDDALFEGTEDLRLQLSNPSANAAIADGDGAGTILDTQPESLIVFQNGGQANAEVLTVGTTSAVASTNTWTGATLSDMWSQPGNWSNLAVPVATDRLLFDLAGAGTTILDFAFTIDELNYSSQASYTLDMAGANTVTSDSITIGQFSPNDQGTLIVRDGTSISATGLVQVGYNSGSGIATGNMLIQTNAELGIATNGALRIGYVTGGGNSSTAGASGTLVLGSESALTLDGAELAIGYNARFNGSGTATGLFDASDDGAEVNLNLTNLLVGAGGSGAPSGTFRWNQSEAILANLVSFSDSGNSVGVLDTRSGETVTFGTAADAIGEFRIGYNGGAATTVGEIDLSVENPFFTAFIDGALRIGYVTGGGNSSTAGASGTLVLGSESALTLDGAELAIGYNARFNGSGTATGLFDASDDGAEVNLNLTNLLVGAGGSGAPSGTFRWNQSEAILANLVSFSDSGNSVGVLDTRSGETVTFGTAADAIGEFRIGYNGGAATTVGEIDLSVENPFFTAFIDGALRIGYVTGGGNSSTAGASGTLVLGSESALTLDGAELAIGYNARFNGSGTATGLFDASDDGAEVNLNLTNLLVGAGGSGAPSGTFRWNQSEAILANLVSFSDSGNSVGVLDTRSGETVTFGTAADAIGEFRIGYNGGAATTVGEIDLSVENPFFTAFIDGALRIGYVTGGGNSSTAGASGTLVLGSESALTLDGAELAIGYNARFNGSGTATGLFDASDDGAEVNLNLTSLLVGAGGSGFTEGTFLIGGGTSLAAITTNVGIGTNSTGIINFFDQTLNVGAVGTLHTETLNFDGGLITGEHLIIDAATGSFSYTDGNLAVNVIDGDLVQQGGFLEAGRGVGQTIINGNYEVESAGGVSIEIDGTTAVSGHDVLSVNGTVSLNADASSGAALDIDLGFAANLGDTFLFFENDGVDLVSGAFDGLAQGGTTTADFGTNRYTFEIDYLAGDGNDVALEIVDIFLL